ncbi:alpha/beta fold hydrolase [Saccharomonospora sp. NPDC046836]|uniref:esterase/lipase family protein n=1 Tax=Saccharomonospora sp. NPDC046836 TaxID=3156921 RepID=UPI0033D26DEB
MSRRPRAAVTALCLLAATLLFGGTAHAAEREPVILVHGFLGSSEDMATMASALEDAGHPAYTIDLPGQENVANAEAIGELVERVRDDHGGAKVSLVGHSMGGLSTRYYLAHLGGTESVLSYVSMGTAQHGYAPACLLPPESGGQMCPDSAFLRELNSGDETPGDVRYTTLFSSLDESRADRLDGAWCVAEFPGVDHAEEPKSPVFIEAVQRVLDGRC